MRIYVKVISRSSQNKIEKLKNGEYRVKLIAPPVGGQANQALVELLAEYFDVAKSQIAIVGGKTFSKKIVDIDK